MNLEQLKRKYAYTLARVGLNVQKGQTVLASFVNHRGSNDDLTDDNPSNNTTTNDNALILPWICICLSSLLISLIITVIKHQKKWYHK